MLQLGVHRNSTRKASYPAPYHRIGQDWAAVWMVFITSFLYIYILHILSFLPLRKEITMWAKAGEKKLLKLFTGKIQSIDFH
jgi:hypothetical protein